LPASVRGVDRRSLRRERRCDDVSAVNRQSTIRVVTIPVVRAQGIRNPQHSAVRRWQHAVGTRAMTIAIRHRRLKRTR
jgi:hypothetical protein